MTQKIQWRCFHCGDAFTLAQRKHALAHFGADESALPVCQLRLHGEHHLLNILRRQESELASFYAEDTELWRALHAQAADHAQALRAEEERGYNKGVVEARAESHDILISIRNSVRLTEEEWAGAPLMRYQALLRSVAELAASGLPS